MRRKKKSFQYHNEARKDKSQPVSQNEAMCILWLVQLTEIHSNATNKAMQKKRESCNNDISKTTWQFRKRVYNQ